MCEKPIVLAVDDDEDSLLLLQYALESLDCTVITETDGQSALTTAFCRKPNLILLDIVLPTLCGMDCIYLLKRNSITQSIPIIAVTALARSEERELIFLNGCDDYVSKPYMLDDLEAAVCRYLPCVPACPV